MKKYNVVIRTSMDGYVYTFKRGVSRSTASAIAAELNLLFASCNIRANREVICALVEEYEE